MTFKIKFISDEVEGFLREIEINSEATFLDLNKVVLESCGYPDDQMTSFFICDDEWERGLQITREDMGGTGVDEDIYVMEETPLSDFIEDEGQNLIFVFDPFSDRVFYMNVKETFPGKTLETPAILQAKGAAPKQIEDLDFSLPPSAKAKTVQRLDDDIYFDEAVSSFNDDEIDMEGFEISDEF